LKRASVAPSNEIDIDQLAEIIKPGQRLIGLDLGSKTIGIAVSDPRLSVSSARTTIRRSKFAKDANVLVKLAKEEEAAAFVLGLPLNMDGSEGPRVQSTRAFARNLSQITNIPVLYWDERLTTVAAERSMLEADLSRRKRAAKVDQVAASLILQGFLDRLSVIRAQ